MPESMNLPDVLGYITGGARADYGVLQAAATVQPNPAKAGRPIDATVILQNATDTPLEVLVVLTVPPKDLSGRGGAFVAKVQRLAIGMQGYEVGVLTLPLLTQPNTTPGEYKLTLQVTAKATGKGNRVRLPEGGGDFYMGGMSRSSQLAIEALRGSRYAGGGKRGLFSGPPALDVNFNLEAGSLGGVLDRKADYRTLWTRRDLKQDPKALLERHREALTTHVLPALDRTRLLEPITRRTMTRFKDSWYELTEIEASLISRVMVLILEYACTGQLAYGRRYQPRPEYEVANRFSRLPTTRTTGSIPIVKPTSTGTIPVQRTTGEIPAQRSTGQYPAQRATGQFPAQNTTSTGQYPIQRGSTTGGIPLYGAVTPARLRWLDEFLILLDEDERAARFVSKYIPERCYDALLRDALTFSLREVEEGTGVELGSEEELERFADEWMEKLESGAIMTFADIYLPLVLAGIMVHDEVLLPDENVKVMHSQLQHLLKNREDERTDQNAGLFDMTRTALEKALFKYGLHLID